MQRYITFSKGEYYHIYNRGIDKRKIFFTKNDWRVFQKQLYIRNSEKSIDFRRIKDTSLHSIARGETLVDIVAYAMMPNHFHLLLFEKQEGGISRFMSKLQTAHAMYMNTKYKRSGPLMCRPFRAKHVDSDEYFRYLISYIHCNPLDSNTGNKDQDEFLRNYHYSSYFDYFNTEREEGLLLNTTALPIEKNEINSFSKMKELLDNPL